MTLALLLAASLASAQDKAQKPDILAVRADCAYVAEALRREIAEAKRDMGEESADGRGVEPFVARMLDRIGKLKGDPEVAPFLHPTLDRTAELLRLYPDRRIAREHPGSMTRAIARQLEATADRSETLESYQQNMKSDLELPADVDMEAKLPKDIPVEKFMKMGPIVIFMCKHRGTYPMGTSDPKKAEYRQITPEDLKAGKYHVGIGVTFTGKVSRFDKAVDGDECFDVDPIHNEIVPQWRSGPRAKLLCDARPGDTVELKGWTYYDNFHKDESDEERAITEGRPTVWEVHPVTECRILKRAPKKP